MPDVSLDPDSLPSDWRSVVKSGAFVILLGLGVMFIGAVTAAPIAKAEIRPVEERLNQHMQEQDRVITGAVEPLRLSVDRHIAETSALRPVMQKYVEEQSRINCGIARNIYELCRLNPQARCVPMGASCP